MWVLLRGGEGVLDTVEVRLLYVPLRVNADTTVAGRVDLIVLRRNPW